MQQRDTFAQLLGIEVEKVREGYCRLHLTVRDDMLNGFGNLHGGVTYSLADTAFGLACNSQGRFSVALSVTMDYLEAGAVGDILTAEVTEESLGNKISIYIIKITNQKGVLIGLFKGTAYRTSKEILPTETT
ncbi:MAG: hydroxyphenylacetyl-CoA thioesterase PaaI [Sphingobacteriales bacterium]|nr:MAG: hydroxyphenylacetyl-CoA thioesterase PaaI [Sphingobacteriales bacterium]